MFFQPKMEFHDHPFNKWQFIVLAQVFFHHHELEIPHGITACKTFIPADNIYFFIGDQVFNHFPEHEVDPWLHPETQGGIPRG